MTQRPDDILSSTAPNAYHVGKAIVDAAAVRVDDLHSARADEIMALAYGVGISTTQSRALVAGKLEEWRKADREMWDRDRDLMDEMREGS